MMKGVESYQTNMPCIFFSLAQTEASAGRSCQVCNLKTCHNTADKKQKLSNQKFRGEKGHWGAKSF